jgi:glycosyltransferase involved in cell wall biosynthesis
VSAANETLSGSSRPAVLAPLPAHPLISIIVPSFNCGAFVRRTIESCLEQDYRPIELVVVDGATTDETLAVLKSFGDIPELRWVSEPDDGPVAAVNKGLRMARGELAGIQSADDFYLPGAFAAAVRCFGGDPGVVLAFADAQKVDAAGRVLRSDPQPAYSLTRLLSRAVYVPQSGAFFRTDVARELGGWDSRTPYVPDARLWLRLAFHGRVVKAAGFWGATREHGAQRDRASSRIYGEYLQMLCELAELRSASLRQRRAARAGAQLVRLRYGGPWTDAQLTRSLWRALLFYPPCWRNPGFPRHRLVSGYFRLAAVAGRVRRALR